ncbi:MAG: DNA-directed RNA polymerase subunit P [Candidatus Micrarchaeota archaeon]
MYHCWKCRKEVKELDPVFVRCPYCGCRVLFKQRQPIARDVKAE